jgi:hypothetical protein
LYCAGAALFYFSNIILNIKNIPCIYKRTAYPMKYTLILVAFTTLLFACKKDNTAAPFDDSKLAGVWTFIGIYTESDYTMSRNDTSTNEVVVGMSENNTGELAIDNTIKSFNFSNFYYETNLLKKNTIRIKNKPDSVRTFQAEFYQTATFYITATYRLGTRDSIVTSGSMTRYFPDTTLAPYTNVYKDEYTLGWSKDTLLLIENAEISDALLNDGYTHDGYLKNIMKFVKK